MARPKRAPHFPRLRENRNRLGLTQEDVADRLGITAEMVRRHEKGESHPRDDYRTAYTVLYGQTEADLGLDPQGQPIGSAIPSIDFARRLQVPARALSVDILPPGDLDISQIRNILRELVILDNQVGGTELVKPARRLFQSLRHQIAKGEVLPAPARKDLVAAVGELAEITGWLAFDADDHELVRRMNHESLYFSRLAGDTSIELLTLQNASMHSASIQAGGESVVIADSVLEGSYRLTPRLRALFLVRKARALSRLGDESALKLLAQARSLYSDGVGLSDPAWTWWIDESELFGHEAICRINLGDTAQSLDYFEQSVERIPRASIRGQYLLRAFLLQAQIEASLWADAGQTTRQLRNLAIPVSSNRADRIILSALSRLGQVEVKLPGELSDEAEQLRIMLEEQ